MRRPSRSDHIVIIGAGLAGLATAAYLARAGQAVTVYEAAPVPGGRARTELIDGYHFNLGPHALYRGGPHERALRELGIPYRGVTPRAAGYALHGGRLHRFPGALADLLRTDLLDWRGKAEAMRFMTRLPRLATADLDRLSLQSWLDGEIRHPVVRQLVAALTRLSGYADDPSLQSAGAALAQLQRASASGVQYLDGGWQTLVDGLRNAAMDAGARLITGRRVLGIDHDSRVRAVRLDDGATQATDTAVIAAGPRQAQDLARPVASLAAWADAAVPVRAACLTLGLSRLPAPGTLFALGIDQPFYYSVHSAAARLAPAGGALVHVARYLATDDNGAGDEAALEALLDRLQPGWRAFEQARRFLPKIVVSHALATAAQGGLPGRPGPAVPEVAGLYVVGDWVGPEGLLSDASLASARRAAATIQSTIASVARSA